LRLFVNPFSLWTDLAFKTGEAILASAHAAAVRANAPKVGVIPTADAPPLSKAEPQKVELPKPHALVRQASKAARFKASRAKGRSVAKAKRRSKRQI
jgi:hypothetical protein